MITLTLRDQRPIAFNCDLIACVTAQPDTVVRMIGGDTWLVLETIDEIVERVIDFRSRILSSVSGDGSPPSNPGGNPRAALHLLRTQAEQSEVTGEAGEPA